MKGAGVKGSKSVVVTGALRGLGGHITRAILNETDFQVISVSRNTDPSSEFLDLLDCSQRLHRVHYDLFDLGGIRSLVASIQADHQIYGLINNSGVGGSSILPTQHETEISNILTLNLHAPILLAKYTARAMLPNKAGRIINIASVCAHTAYKGLAVYAGSKAGLIAFTRTLGRELAPAGIAVNSISPGFMATDMTSELGSRLHQIRKRSPLNELAYPTDVADLVINILKSKHIRYTGLDYIVDSGNSL